MSSLSPNFGAFKVAKFQIRHKAFVIGEAKINPDTGERRYPKDKADDVGIILWYAPGSYPGQA